MPIDSNKTGGSTNTTISPKEMKKSILSKYNIATKKAAYTEIGSKVEYSIIPKNLEEYL